MGVPPEYCQNLTPEPFPNFEIRGLALDLIHWFMVSLLY